MIQINKTQNIVQIITTKALDREDVEELIEDLQKWLDETAEVPKFKGIDEKALEEAKYYSQQKRLLEEGMKEYIASIKPTQHIEKELKTIELDPIDREIIIDKIKLKPNGKKGI